MHFKTWIKSFLFIGLLTSHVYAEEYQKAVETEENVKNKLYPRSGRLEFAGPAFGMILNQSYIESYGFHFGMTYFINETWGLGIEGLLAQNTDKSERTCIENFFNDQFEEVGPACLPEGGDPSQYLINENGEAVRGANMGPAYVAIREIQNIAMATLVWNPIYGKQLAFLSFTSYFDIYTTMGLGLTFSEYYPESVNLRDGRRARAPFPRDVLGCPKGSDSKGNKVAGVCPDDPEINSLIGIAGRPTPQSQSTPTMTFGIGQKIHFKKYFHIKGELRNYTLLGTESGFESIFAVWLGLGVRI